MDQVHHVGVLDLGRLPATKQILVTEERFPLLDMIFDVLFQQLLDGALETGLVVKLFEDLLSHLLVALHRLQERLDVIEFHFVSAGEDIGYFTLIQLVELASIERLDFAGGEFIKVIESTGIDVIEFTSV